MAPGIRGQETESSAGKNRGRGETPRAEGRTHPTGRHQGTGHQPPRLSLSNRYSLFVGVMKVLLPATAAALVLLVVAWPRFSIEVEDVRLSVSKLAPRQAENLTMLNARFEGRDEKDQPFSVTADIATQSESDKDLVTLELPKADITLQDGAWLALTARSGEYRKDAQVLDLTGSVNLYHDKGFELRTEAARIHLDLGMAEGANPVQGQSSLGTIQAEGFKVLDRGARIFFLGRSHLVIEPQAQREVR